MPTQKFNPLSVKLTQRIPSAWAIRIGIAVVICIILLLMCFGTAAR